MRLAPDTHVWLRPQHAPERLGAALPLVAHALEEGACLVSGGAALRRYDVEVIDTGAAR